GEEYSEAPCREPDATFLQVARHTKRQLRRRGWAAEPSFRGHRPGDESAPRIDPREPQPGVIPFEGAQVPPNYAPTAGSGAPAVGCSWPTCLIVRIDRIAPPNAIAAPTYSAWCKPVTH